LKLFEGRLCTCWIVATVEVSGDRQTSFCSCGANEVQDLLVTVERLASPVFGDFGKETMLDGVPLGSARRIVGNGESQTERVGKLRLEFGFPGAAASAIAAAGVAEDEELAGAWIADRPLLAPPMCNSVRGKGRCVMRDTHHDRPSIGEQIIDAVRDGNAGGIRAEVVVVDQAGRPIPARAGIFEVTDQFAFLCVDANDGQAAALEALPKINKIEELIIAIGTEIGGEFLVIDAQRIAHLVEETSDSVGTHDDAEVAQSHGNLISSASRPLQPSDGIAGGVVFEQELDQSNDVGGFFSTGLRPPPERRVRSADTF
jgi:hypothetical protein